MRGAAVAVAAALRRRLDDGRAWCTPAPTTPTSAATASTARWASRACSSARRCRARCSTRTWWPPPPAGWTGSGACAATAWSGSSSSSAGGLRSAPGDETGIRPPDMRTCVRMSYVELHCHSAFSFLDGASLPDELVAAALERGHTALALTDHDSVSGSMEFAQAARDLGGPAGHPRRGGDGRPTADVRRRRATSRCSCATPAAGPTSAGCSPARTRTRACTTPSAVPRREGRGAARLGDADLARVGDRVTLEDVEDHAEGLVCLSGCARQGVRDEPTMRRLLRAFGRDALPRRAAAPLPPPRPRAQPRPRRARRAPRRALRGDGQRPRAHARARAAAGRLRGHPRAHDARRLRAAAPRQPQPRARHAGGDGRALRRPPRRGRRDRSAWPTRCASTSPATSATATPAPRTPGPIASWPRSATAASRPATRTGIALRGEAAARLEEELRLIAALGLSGFFLLHRDMLELAREVAVEVRGRDTVARAAAARARARVVGVLDRLLPHRPLARRPDRQQAAARALPQRGDLGAARHRPRLPARRARGPHPARARALRARPRRRSSPPSRPTARAARSASSARRSGLPPGEIERVARGSEGWRGEDVDRDIATALGAGRARPRAAGRGWRALAEEAHGLPRHLSQHSGGMIVATRPLVDCCPVVPAAMEGRQMVMWDKDSCSDAGFLKIDLLGLGMLSAVERCVELIAARRGERIDLSRIPYDDPRDLRGHPGGRDHRRLPDREPRADGLAAAHAPGEPRRPHDPGRDRAPRADPGRRGQPLHRAPPAPARGPRLRGPLRPPVARAGPARHARHDHLPGPGHRGRDGLRGLLAGRGRGPAPGDEPQALGGGDRGPPPALRRGRDGALAPTSTRRWPSACGR